LLSFAKSKIDDDDAVHNQSSQTADG